MSDTRVYLDAGGSAPLSARAREALTAGIAEGWADPGRLHHDSRRARALLDGARDAIADVLGVQLEQVHFTASPHEGFNRVIAGIAKARRGRTRIAASAIERDAVLHACEFVTPHAVDVIAVDQWGRVDPESLTALAAHPDTALLAVQHANQEVATVQDLETIAGVAGAHQVPLVVDATASLGHIDPPAHWDALVAHPADWGGPSGLGVVAVRPATRWLAAWPEGDEWSAGPVSVPAALAAAVALQEREQNRAQTAQRLAALVDRIRAHVATMEGVHVMGDPDGRLPHVVTFVFLYLDGEPLLSALDRAGFAVGSGSACAHSSLDPSRVLASLGALTHGNIRLALHPGVTDQDVTGFLAALDQAVGQVRQSMTA